jgi:hypothetical protein
MVRFINLNSSAIRSITIKNEEDKVFIEYQSSEKEYTYTADTYLFLDLLNEESDKEEPSYGRLVNRSIKEGILELIES